MKKPLLLRKWKRLLDGWLWVSIAGAAVILLPILYILGGLLRPVNDNWVRVKQYLVTDYVIGSVKLVLYTGFFATAIGVGLAWLIAGYSFPLRRFFRWGLLLPLAVPPYIAAYTYRTMTGYTGFIQASLRNHFDVKLPPGLIEVMSFRGAVFVLTLFLFPYVYMIVRIFLERQSATYIENARLLGAGRGSLLFKVVLPLARPAIIAGAMLVVFEVLSDFGVASYFGVQTISTAIFQTWFSMYDVDSAVRLAAWLMLVIVGIFIAERLLRRSRRFHASVKSAGRLEPKRLKGWAAFGATAFCSAIFLLAFAVPVLQLAQWSFLTFANVWRTDFVKLMSNSVTGALLGTLLVIVIAVISARTVRLLASSWGYGISRLMTAGYAIPGAVVAIGVLAVFIELDHRLSPFYAWIGRGEGALLLSMSLAMLITGYTIRFMATGYNAIDAGYEKIPRSYAEASRMLGVSSAASFVKVELPLLKGAIGTGIVLTFVEIVKELPLTLLLRPFNFDTLATRTYQYAVDERIYEAAFPSLILVVISLISVLVMLRLERSHVQ